MRTSLALRHRGCGCVGSSVIGEKGKIRCLLLFPSILTHPHILHAHGRIIAPLPLPFGEVPSQYPSIQAGLGWPRDEHLRMRRILLQVLKASFGRALST